MYDEFWEQFSKGATPSYEYYEEMVQEQMPGYRVELAKSGRSKCDACKNGRSKLSASANLTDGTEPSGQKEKTKSTNDSCKSSTTDAALVAVSEGPRRSSRRTRKPDMFSLSTVDKKNDPKLIPQGNIRIGSLDDQSGSYGRWNHLVCWRVPYRIWAGLTDITDPEQVKQDLLLLEDILFDGVSTLPEKETNLLIAHIMDEKNRVKKRKSKKAIPNLEKLRKEAEAAKAAAAATANAAAEKKDAATTNRRSRDDGPNDDGKISDGAKVVKNEEADEDDKKPAAKKQKVDAEPDVDGEPDVNFPDDDDDDDDDDEEELKDESKSSSTALALKGPTKKSKFVIPRPGVNGAQAGVYEGKRFVLTGLFPEVGGGAGLNLGKDRVKSMIESFGGRVTGSVSGKTDFLVVGKQPGASKVRKAKEKDIPLVDLKSLNDRILGTLPALEQAEAPAIRSFSAGYQTARIANY